MYRVAVITISDKAARGEREDTGGQTVRELVEEQGWEVRVARIVSDDLDTIAETLSAVTSAGIDLVITTGGTGLGPRDNTPEATLSVIEREVPGIAEAMRFETFRVSPRAILSRGVAGIRGKTLIINLPGSPKAVRECLTVVLPVVGHGLAVLTGRERECAGG
ncbi:MAG TPA: MogA/MoaB family molybdenum cofactor biosynthesis protein [Desulfotomaculum sp.]|nr:MogA/MoaB family molybdenum cofactor biosynthesis protein [Desulfotomaculum sp.]